MTPARRSAHVAFVAALHIAFICPAQADAADPVELRAPLPGEVEKILADQLAKLPESLRESFPTIVAATHERIRAGAAAAEDGSGSAIGIEEAARASVLAADFGGAANNARKREAMVGITVLQIAVDMHAAIRELVGLRLAVRAVKACKGKAACLDKIAATAEMSARQVTAVRAEIGNDITALANAELAIGKEIDRGRERALDNLQKLLDIIRSMGVRG